MKTPEEVALGIIEQWQAKEYRNDCQAKAALQVLIADALKSAGQQQCPSAS